MPEEEYRPWTWRAPEGFSPLERESPRQDAHDKVSGGAVFTRDIVFPGMLYAKILTSPYAHARIVEMDTRKAEALTGVRDILRFDDPDIALENSTGGYCAGQYNILTLPATADFYQHPMGVVVVADSEELCDRALRLIEIKWEERPFILDMEASLKPGAPRIMPEVVRLNRTAVDPNTVMTAVTEIGDVGKGFAEADKIIEYTMTRPTNTVAGVEAMACVVQWRDDFLDIWPHHTAHMQAVLSNPSIQAIGLSQVSLGFGSIPIEVKEAPKDRSDPLPPICEHNKITVTVPYQGAWYGGIAWLGYSTAFMRMAAILAKRAKNRPVKVLYDESNFYCNGDEAGTYRCRIGAQKDGTITALDWHVIGPIGEPHIDKTHESTGIPNLRNSQEWALVNTGHHMCWRHGANCCVPHNVMFDKVAAEFGLDPTEVALRNDGCRGHYWDWVTRYQKENGFPRRHSLKEVIELGKKAIDWDRKRHAPGARRLPNGRMHGLGFVHINEWSWITGRQFACLILREGKLTIIGLRADFGMDTESAFRQCVAAEAGLRYEDIVIQQQRSDANTYMFWVPGGAMGISQTTPQLVIAAREMKKKILAYAVRPRRGAMMSKPGTEAGRPLFPGKTVEELDVKDGFVFEKAHPENRKTVRETASSFWGDDPAIFHPVAPQVTGLTLDGKPHSRMYIMSRQAHFLEVEVDTETGEIIVTDLVCVNDVGHLFNRRGAEAQQYGGAIMGLGRSATEEKAYCPRTGVGLNFGNIGYYIGTMNDYPEIRCIINESHLGYSSYG
ncbi:MAG TPA: molybdopterin cofactor-binding domain-containing protein, partial [Acidobacteriota bacterium]|nr:molybdopterin cofactor-binding domain-containing protein [Acidobacteriota bacterium]